ncbi:MAG: hypothetical protein QN143_10715, partial [Armatimonadota bacterium]|nr:hypothetical protein [Armatimonadota bacterium]
MDRGYRITRREFLASLPAAAAALSTWKLPEELLSFTVLQPLEPGLNPLQRYPNRDWEKVYRELYTPDFTFHYLCAPN